uniref:Kelch-like protein 28-like n=1 Tax=Saccoglossus kowalevskii TaxID=10224 RepID=A0ABM0LUA5_SACKO|nr:PREDICTED: kelch-like protein 28-like [Saccoglossus kowalevskii]
MGLLNRVAVQNWTQYCKFFRQRKFVTKLSSCYQCTSSSVIADSDFEKYSLSEDFLASSKEAVIDVISRDDLKIKDESRIFSAVMRWVMRDKKERQVHISDLLNHVRYPYILKDPSPLYLFYLAKHKIPEIALLHEKQRNYWKLTYSEKLCHHRYYGLRPRLYDEVLVSLPGNRTFKMQEKSKTYATKDSTTKTITLKNFIKFDYFVFEDGKVKLVDSPFCYYDSEGRKPAAMQMVDNGLAVVMVTQDADTWVLDYRSGPVRVTPMLKDAADRRNFATNPYIECKNTVRLKDELYFFHCQPSH